MVKACSNSKYCLSRISRYFAIPRSTLYRERTGRPGKRLLLERDDLKRISEIFYEKKQRVGIRQLKMLIFKRYGAVMNLKKIARIKKKFGLFTVIRKKRPYFKFLKLRQEHRTFPNHLNRKFSGHAADEVYSTDITQLNYGSNQKAYLAVFKDLGTKEIISSNLSARLDTELVNQALEQAIKRLPYSKRAGLMIHSDQGFHFTHFSYRAKLAANGIKQSMSRKGNCIDNAPIESFFGYLKDHLESKSCRTLNELKSSVTKEIKYYNHSRPQWDLKKMPPKQYRRHLTLSRGFLNCPI